MLPVILDTDFSSDVDDVGDLMLCLALHKAGFIDLLGVVVSSSNPKSPGAVSAFCTAFGMPSVPIAAWTGNYLDPNGPGEYVGPIYDAYPRRIGLTGAEDSIDLYRRLLNGKAAESVTIVATGGANCLNQLRVTSPDSLQSVRELVWAVGQYPENPGSEFNIGFDPGAASEVMAYWPTQITYSGYENGVSILTGANLATAFAAADIGRYAYDLWSASHGGSGRSAWGQQAILWAVFGRAMFSTVRGSNAFAPTNSNAFTPAADGKDQYTVMALAETTYSTLLNGLLTRRDTVPGAWPYKQSLISIALP